MKTLELPFAYVEKGENKMALVKVVLCDKCCKKLMWKRNKEKEKQRAETLNGEAEAEDSRQGDTRGEADERTNARVKEEVSCGLYAISAGLNYLLGCRAVIIVP